MKLMKNQTEKLLCEFFDYKDFLPNNKPISFLLKYTEYEKFEEEFKRNFTRCVIVDQEQFDLLKKIYPCIFN